MREVELISVYENPDAARITYQILEQRKPWHSIQHKQMPPFEEHEQFFYSNPYAAWYLIKDISRVVTDFDVQRRNQIVGSISLSKTREIGIFLYEYARGEGIGSLAVKALMAKHPGRFVASIKPQNTQSLEFFKSLGFEHSHNVYISETRDGA